VKVDKVGENQLPSEKTVVLDSDHRNTVQLGSWRRTHWNGMMMSYTFEFETVAFIHVRISSTDEKTWLLLLALRGTRCRVNAARCLDA
jgi:hypothetical protein